jgi:hypothetical protein
MAKEQHLALNPSKVSGMCGRLMCCLTYEYETYIELNKQFPRIGSIVDTPNGAGRVIKFNIISKKVDVFFDNPEQINSYKVDELKIKTDGRVDNKFIAKMSNNGIEVVSEDELRKLEDKEIKDIKDTFIKTAPGQNNNRQNNNNNNNNYNPNVKKNFNNNSPINTGYKPKK